MAHWQYFGRDDGKENVVICLNTDCGSPEEVRAFPNLLQVFINVYAAAENKEEGEALYEQLRLLEERLEGMFLASGTGLYIGRLESSLQIEYYLYTDETGEETARGILEEFPQVRNRLHFRRDEEWDHFLYLEPNEREKLDSINRNMLYSLEQKGFRTGALETLHHWIRMPSRTARDELRELLARKGYKLEGMELDPQHPAGGYILQMSKPTKLDADILYPVTTELMEEAAAAGGLYEGWGLVPKEKLHRKLLRFRGKLLRVILFGLFVVLMALLGLYLMDHEGGEASRLQKMLGIDQKEQAALQAGTQAPVLTLTDPAGKEVTIGGEQALPTVVQYCLYELEPCHMAAAALAGWAEGSSGWARVIAVHMAEPKGLQPDPHVLHVYDKDSKFRNKYKMNRFPATIWISPEGTIEDVWIGTDPPLQVKENSQ